MAAPLLETENQNISDELDSEKEREHFIRILNAFKSYRLVTY